MRAVLIFSIVLVGLASRVASVGSRQYTLNPCPATETQVDFLSSSSWTPTGVPGALDSIVVNALSCKVLFTGSGSVASATVDNSGELAIDADSSFTVTNDLVVTGVGMLTMRSNTSSLTVGGTLSIVNGVFTGTGTITGNVFCSQFCEMDILSWGASALDYTGKLNIVGDVYFEQTPMNGTASGQPHGLVVLGGRGSEFSSFAVNGKITIERMTVSLLLSPNIDSFATLPSDMISATGGITYFNASTSYDSRQTVTVIIPQDTGVANYVLPPFPSGVHEGRYAVWFDSTTSGTGTSWTTTGKTSASSTESTGTSTDGGTGGSSSTTLTNGCSPTSGSSLSILLGACSSCPTGQVFSPISSTCVPDCSDPTCGGHGTCVIGLTEGYCDCGTGWTGLTCQLPNCLSYNGAQCNLRGDCLAPTVAGQLGQCNCLAGWDSQPDCSVYIAPGSNSNGAPSSGAPSSGSSNSNITSDGTVVCNNVTCGRVATGCTDAGLCACPEKWTGAVCDTPICPNSCSSNGVCSTDRLVPVCDCSGSYTGSDCSQIVGANGATIAGLPQNTFIGAVTGAAIAFVILVAVAIVLIVKFSRAAKTAVRPYSVRAPTIQSDL